MPHRCCAAGIVNAARPNGAAGSFSHLLACPHAQAWFHPNGAALLPWQNFAVSIASAQLEEGTILVDPASGNVTSIPSDGGHFAPFQVDPPSGRRARAVRQLRLRSLPQTARRGARAPRRKRAACRARQRSPRPFRTAAIRRVFGSPFGGCSEVARRVLVVPSVFGCARAHV